MTWSLINFAGFQVGWFACVLGAAAGQPALGPLIVTGVLALHLALNAPRRPEVLLIIAAAVVGYFADSLLVIGGWLAFPPEAALGRPSTVWMVALWMNFAATLNSSMRWLSGRWLLAAVVGAVAGPATYYAGGRFGAIVVPDAAGLAAIGVEWLIATPALLWLAAAARRLGDGRSSIAPQPAGSREGTT